MGDDWIAVDKFEHLAMCFFIVIMCVYTIRLSFTPSKLLYRCATPVGCILSLTIGAVKELGDQMGLWPSAGGSLKDGLADVGGVLLAATLLHFLKPRRPQPMHDEALELQGSMAV
jgi:hypothetical protein|uniref:VanZ-like domain-containing protein n=1 Tax=Picea sitchensis TaxID=3332 RepID=D5A9V0_PICSI|nr:unknown [Picea sitchensis]